jgi:hypothetical protein
MQCVQCLHACSTSLAQAAVCLIILASLGSVGLERASDRSCDSFDGTPGKNSVSPTSVIVNSGTEYACLTSAMVSKAGITLDYSHYSMRT